MGQHCEQHGPGLNHDHDLRREHLDDFRWEHDHDTHGYDYDHERYDYYDERERRLRDCLRMERDGPSLLCSPCYAVD